MLNLQPVLDPRLWTAIEGSYQTGNFTGSILDSIYFLGQLIRDRSGLETDGVALVGEAFGGNTPKLKVNSLQTESDRNIQRGVEQLLRGLYQGIRNPRSHEKYKDSSEDADAIVLFINYLVKMIDQSKSPFDINSYLDRVFDPSLSESERYADLIVSEIPPGKRWDTLVLVYRLKQERGRHWNKLRFFFRSLLKMLSPEDIASFCKVVSDELRITHSDDVVLKILQMIPDEYWLQYDEIARIRTESKLIASIRDGRCNDRRRATTGVLGTWASGLEKYFVLKDELTGALVAKINSAEEEEQDYAVYFFVNRIVTFLPEPTPSIGYVLLKQLQAGNKKVHHALWFLDPSNNPTAKWRKDLGEAYDNFVAKPEETDASQGITDDDVPF